MFVGRAVSFDVILLFVLLFVCDVVLVVVEMFDVFVCVCCFACCFLFVCVFAFWLRCFLMLLFFVCFPFV